MERNQIGMVSNGRRWSAVLRNTAAALCVLAGTAGAQGGQLLTPVALAGDQSGVLGVTISGFDFRQNLRPAIASNGDISYVATLTGTGVTGSNNTALYVRRNDSSELVLREGDSTQIGASTGFNSHVISSTAWAVVEQTGAGPVLQGHWAGSTNTLIFAGASGWGSHTVDDIGVPSLNDAGDLAVAVRTTDVVTAWRVGRTSGESLVFPLIEPGDDISGLTGAVVSSVAGYGVGVNSFGRVATFARAENAPGQTVITNGVNEYVILTGDSDGVALVSQTGTHAPNFITGVNLTDFGFTTATQQHVNVNNSGEAVFSGTVAGLGITVNDDTALFRSEGSTTARLVRESSPAPGAGVGVTFRGFPPEDLSAPVFTNSSAIFFMQDLGGTGTGNGLFTGDQGGMVAIAYHNMQAPDLASGVLISSVLAFDANNRNQAVYLAQLTGTGVSSNNDTALFAYNGTTSTLLIREGDLYSVAAENRTVSDIWLDAGGAPDSNITNGRRALNDAGQGVVAVAFADAMSGVFTFDLPTPCATTVTLPTSVRAIEGTRTRVQGTAEGASSVQWLANGQAITNGDTYTGSDTTLLSITRASTALDGTFVTLAASNACGTVAANPLELSVGKRLDVNKDGLNEIIWRNYSSGANLAWNVASDASAITSSYALPSVSDTNWKLAASADFNYDGNLDLVWRNSVTGDNAVWFMNGVSFASASDLPRVSDTTWEIRSVADFDNDGIMDILWRNSVSGANVVWLMNLSFATVNSAVAIPTVTEPYWQIAGTGDFNADGSADIVWRNARTGAHAVWYMNGTTFSSAADISPASSDVNVRIVAIADYTSDSKPDLLMRNTLTGTNELWRMDGVDRLSAITLPTVADTLWRPMGQPSFSAGQDSDFNGDGKADVFFRHSTNGQNAVWLLDGPTFSSLVNLTPITENNWVVEAVADISHDNKTDVFWRNRVTGQNVLWIMNGTTLSQSIDLPSVSTLAWHVGAVADVDGDEIADLIWNNDDTGENLAWILDGTPADGSVVRRLATLPSQTSASWNLRGTGDFDRDNKYDLVFRFDGASVDPPFTGGDDEYWRMSGTTRLSRVTLPQVSSLNWDIRAVNDYNLDGYPDLLWRNNSTGANTIWFMRGSTLGNSVALPTVSDIGWQICR